jgi:FixJ family two-component response regulator
MSKISEATVVAIVTAREAQKPEAQQAREIEAYIASLSPVERQIFNARSTGNFSLTVEGKDVNVSLLVKKGYTIYWLDTGRIQISW